MPKAEFARINAELEEAGQAAATPTRATPPPAHCARWIPAVTASRRLAPGPTSSSGRPDGRQPDRRRAAGPLGAPWASRWIPTPARPASTSRSLAFMERLARPRATSSSTRRMASWSRSIRSTSRRAWAWCRAPRAGRSPTSSRPSRSTTRLEDIVAYVGRTGALTPVAHMTPVRSSGSDRAPRATLHNLDEVRRKDLRVGDMVVLQKAGRRHPRGRRARSSTRAPATEREWQMPDDCPVCGTPIVRDEGEVVARCPNPFCPAQVVQGMLHFTGRGGMDVEGAGWKVLVQLVERGLLTEPADLYRLTPSRSKALARPLRAKSAENLFWPPLSVRGRGRCGGSCTASGSGTSASQTAIDLAELARRDLAPAEGESDRRLDGARGARLRTLPGERSRRCPASARPWRPASRLLRATRSPRRCPDSSWRPGSAPNGRRPPVRAPLRQRSAGREDGGRHRDAVGSTGRGRGRHPGGRRPCRRVGQPQDRLPGRGRERGFQAGEGGGAGRGGPG